MVELREISGEVHTYTYVYCILLQPNKYSLQGMIANSVYIGDVYHTTPR